MEKSRIIQLGQKLNYSIGSEAELFNWIRSWIIFLDLKLNYYEISLTHPFQMLQGRLKTCKEVLDTLVTTTLLKGIECIHFSFDWQAAAPRNVVWCSISPTTWNSSTPMEWKIVVLLRSARQLGLIENVVPSCVRNKNVTQDGRCAFILSLQR